MNKRYALFLLLLFFVLGISLVADYADKRLNDREAEVILEEAVVSARVMNNLWAVYYHNGGYERGERYVIWKDTETRKEWVLDVTENKISFFREVE